MSTRKTPVLRAVSGSATWLRPDMIVAVVTAVVLLPPSLVLLGQEGAALAPAATGTVAALLIVLLAAPLLAVLHPLPAFALVTAAMAALTVLPFALEVSAALYPSGIGYLLCLGQIASRSPRSLSLAAWGSGVLGAALIALTAPELAVAARAGAGLRLGAFAGLAAAVTAAWAVGLLLRVRRAQAEQRVHERMGQAIVDERMRISRDLHDVVAHAMTVMIAQADAARAVVHDDPDRASAALAVVGDTGREALRGMRAVVRADPDAPREPAPVVDDIPALVDAIRSPLCDASFEERGIRHPLPAPTVLALHRAVREALTNAVRHTRHPVRIMTRLEWSDVELRAAVTDDGGAGTAGGGLGSGTGLIGASERVTSVGGTLEAGPEAHGGWSVTVRLPFGEAGR
ncbi:histidine kinase [Microbacterium sp.]|uniref:sensor histidine kinase n=1 Tax=Microbacterium sp. TaxID=51671 RepID=UPI002810F42A|nr:histidine kinase [Microbacterium sp.]